MPAPPALALVAVAGVAAELHEQTLAVPRVTRTRGLGRQQTRPYRKCQEQIFHSELNSIVIPPERTHSVLTRPSRYCSFRIGIVAML